MSFLFLLDAIFELFGEFILAVVLESLGEAFMHLANRNDWHPFSVHPWLIGLGYALFGAAAGGVSLWLLPHSLPKSESTRLAYLAVAPVLIGALMAVVGRWRERRGQPKVGIDHFYCGWLFAFALALVRHLCAHPA